MADLGNRANVNSAIDLLLDDLQPDEAIQPSDHNVLLKDILDTLANGLSTVLRTGNTTDGQNLTITSSSIFQFSNGSNGRLQSDTLTAFRNWTLPDTTGTIALLSDIPSADNIYTANGTLTGDRTVDLDNNILTFDVGIFSGVGVDKGLIIDGSDYQITNTNSTNSFLEVFNENGSVFNALQRGGILSYSDVNPLAFLLSRDSTKGLKLDTDNSRISTNELIFNNSFSGNQGIYLRGSGVTNDLFFRDSLNQIQHRIRQGDSGATASFFYSGMNGKGFIVGGSSAISTEDISLQGSTLIKGNGTSTGSALAIYDNDTTPNKLWDFLDNGTLNKGDTLLNIGNSNSITGGTTSYALGWNNNITGGTFGRLAIGDSNSINGNNVYTIGRYNVISASNIFQFGNFLQSGARGAFIIGHGVYTDSAQKLVNNTADSLALGWNTTTPQHLFKSDGVNLTLSTDSTGTVVGDVWSQNGTVKIGNPSANITTVASVGGLTVNADTTEVAKVLALATNITINAPTGTPNDNQSLWFRILDNGTSRTITLNAVFEDYTGNFPTSTTAGKYLIFAGKWNADEGKWNILAWKVQP